MASKQYKDWLKTKEGKEPVLNPDGIKGVPTHGHGYAYGRMNENGRFVPDSASKVNADLNYAKGTIGTTYVTPQAMESMRGKTQDELRDMFKNKQPEGLGTQLNPQEMDRLQDISIGEAEEDAKNITGNRWDKLTPAQQDTLTDLRYRGGNYLYRKNQEEQTTGRSSLYDHIQNGNEAGAAYEIMYNSNKEKAAGNDVREMERMDAWLAEKTPQEREQFKKDLDAYINESPIRQDKREAVNQRLQQQKNKGNITHTAEDILKPQPKEDNPSSTEPTLPDNQQGTNDTQNPDTSSIGDKAGAALGKVAGAVNSILDFLRGSQSQPTVIGTTFNGDPIYMPDTDAHQDRLGDIFKKRTEQEPNPYLMYETDMRRFIEQRSLYGNANGEVRVKGYSRSTGTVKEHTRTTPDETPSNNLSYRKK